MSDAAIDAAERRAAPAAALISARAVDKSFHDAGREIVVLRGLDLEVAAGEEIAIIGESGVGKSTLLHVLGSLERPTAGQILFEDRDLFALDERETAEFRNHKLGFVFQFHYLLADFSALENVMMPALIARLADREARAQAESVLELVGLKDKLHRRPALRAAERVHQPRPQDRAPQRRSRQAARHRQKGRVLPVIVGRQELAAGGLQPEDAPLVHPGQ